VLRPFPSSLWIVVFLAPPLAFAAPPTINRPPETIWSLAFTPDGKTLIGGCADHTVRLWDAVTNKEIRRLTGHQGGVSCVAISVDGKLLASASHDHTLRVWRLLSGAFLQQIQTPHGIVRGVAFAPNGRTMASGGADGVVCLWDVATGKLLKHLQGHAEMVTCVAFSPDGKLLASGGWDNVVCIWDAASGKQNVRLDKRLKVVVSLAFAPDSKTLVAGTFGANPLIHWDVATGRELHALKVPFGFLSYATFSPAGDVIAGVTTGPGNDAIHLWDVSTGKARRRFVNLPSAVQCLAYSLDGKKLAAGCLDGSLRVWEPATGQKQFPSEGDAGHGLSPAIFEGHEREVTAVAFSADGRWLATASLDQTLRLWDPVSHHEVRRFLGHEQAVWCVAIAADGQTVVSGGQDRTVRLWDTVTGRMLKCCHGHRADVVCVAISPDGKTLLSGGTDNTLRIWEASTGKEIEQLSTSASRPAAIAFSPCSRWIAYRGADDAFHLYDRSVHKDRSLPGAAYLAFSTFAFAPDGHTLAFGRPKTFSHPMGQPVPTAVPGSVAVWELASDSERRELALSTGANEPLTYSPDLTTLVTYSPDGRALAVADTQKRVEVWDLPSGRRSLLCPAHHGSIAALAFAPDGETLAVACGEDTVITWQIPPAKRRPTTAPSAQQLEIWWAQLKASEGRPADEPIWSLVAAGSAAVPFLCQRLQKTPELNVQEIPRLISDLDSNRYPLRQKAMEDLELFGELAEPALRQALQGKPSLEVRQRVERLLQRVGSRRAPEWLRATRALEVLEQIGTDEARQALQTLAKGPANSLVAVEARAALDRLERRPRALP
jgi:WD40 repeat protein